MIISGTNIDLLIVFLLSYILLLFAIDECKVLCVWPVEVNKCKISNSKKNTQYFYVNIVTALFTSTNIILFLYFFYIFKSRVRLIRCIQCSIFDTFVSICTLCFIPTLLTAKLYKSVTQVKKNYIQTCFIFSSICSASPWTGGSESWSFSQWTCQLLGHTQWDQDGVEWGWGSGFSVSKYRQNSNNGI